MRKVRLVPVEGEEEIDLYLLMYRVDQLEKWRERLEQAPRERMERKESQAVINNTTIQWLLLLLVVISTLTQLANLFHL
jgi:hypothetical protein